jgi:16S rRNA (guanine(966)-N(2))-methyltransferase RsmD
MDTTRSSKSVVKESYFNTIQFEIIDANIVEVFSGSGSVGLEALSRGAGFAYFMEKDKNAFDVLSKNIHNLGVKNSRAIRGNSFENIYQVIKTLSGLKQKAFFYIDPPFSFREGMEDIYNNMIDLIAAIPVEMIELVTIEHMTGLELPESIGSLKKKKTKKFGKTSLTHYIL